MRQHTVKTVDGNLDGKVFNYKIGVDVLAIIAQDIGLIIICVM